MKYHSISSIDLEEDSYIGIYSYYKCDCKKTCERTLFTKNKETNEFKKIVLSNNSLILFSTDTNKKFLHKIVLEYTKDTNCKWLGITFKRSKKFIKYGNSNDEIYDFPSMDLMHIASDEEKSEFYKLKTEENKSIDFKFPELKYIW
jgi:hypothetical protein